MISEKQNSRPAVALTRFKRTLRWARPETLRHVHTLCLPPAQAELYDGPHAEWLRDVLDDLPNLQSLIVTRLPFFDHQALSALRHYKSARQNLEDTGQPIYSLRLLIAAECKNMTASSLAEALVHFAGLVYLDLSGNSSARDFLVLSKLRNMSSLHVLRLQNCQMKDSDMDVFGKSIGRRVRSLDLCNNFLTDSGVRTLLQHCFHSRGSRSRASSGFMNEDSADWPVGIARPDAKILDDFRDDTLSENLVKRLTNGPVNRLPSQDLRQTGVTHFYVAGNNLSVEGVSSLIRNALLYVLDVGPLQTSKIISKPRTTSSSSPPTSAGYRIHLPGAGKLVPILDEYGSDLRYLRLHHSVVTEEAAPKSARDSCKSVELEASDACNELDSTPVVPELPIDEPAPRYELPGDAMQIILSPPTGKPPLLDTAEEMPAAKRGSVFAPEVTNSLIKGNYADRVLTSTDSGSVAQAMNGISADEPQDTLQSSHGDDPGAKSRSAEIQELLHGLRSQEEDGQHGLLPEMLPQLRTLVLTSVPCFDNARVTIDFLIRFIKLCARIAEIARLEALLKHESLRIAKYPVSSGNRFSLQKIVLEMSVPNSIDIRHRLNSPQTPHAPSSAFRTKSSTEDADSEAFWLAQENDFSFFDDDEECGLPSKEAYHFPLSTLSEKMAIASDAHQEEPLPTLEDAQRVNPGVDVVQELSNFRKDRKAAYERAVSLGKYYVEGYWPGEIKILRWNAK